MWGYSAEDKKDLPIKQFDACLAGQWERDRWVCGLNQIQFDGTLDRRTAIRDIEFTKDILGMGA